MVAVLKINNDLERMADHAVNIARRAEYLTTYPDATLPLDLEVMVQRRRRWCVRAWMLSCGRMRWHVGSVPQMRKSISSIDRCTCSSSNKFVPTERVEQLVHQLSVSRQLERIGDLATNVAEDVVYTVEGAIIRHRTAVICVGNDAVSSRWVIV